MPQAAGRHGWQNLTLRAEPRSSPEPPKHGGITAKHSRTRSQAAPAFVPLTPSRPDGCGLPDVELQS